MCVSETNPTTKPQVTIPTTTHQSLTTNIISSPTTHTLQIMKTSQPPTLTKSESTNSTSEPLQSTTKSVIPTSTLRNNQTHLHTKSITVRNTVASSIHVHHNVSTKTSDLTTESRPTEFPQINTVSTNSLDAVSTGSLQGMIVGLLI